MCVNSCKFNFMKNIYAIIALLLFFRTAYAQGHSCSVIKVTAFSRSNLSTANADTVSSDRPAEKERFIYLVSCCNIEPVIKLMYGKIRAKSTVQEESGRTIIAGRDSSGRKIVIGAPLGFSIWRVNITGPVQLMNSRSAVKIQMRGTVAKNGFAYRNIPEKQLYGVAVL